MGETLQPVTPGFNRSLRIESRPDRLTGDAGAVVLREILERSGIVPWMVARLKDPRRQEDVTHDLASLIRTGVLLAAQGWRDHDDADALRHDPASRLATSSSAGLTPLADGGGLRRAERKAWNAYLVFLAPSPGDYGENIMVGGIEEDLVGTRKIARAGIADAADVRAALLPLLAIQNAPRLDAVDMPAEIRLRTTELPSKLVDGFLSGASENTLLQLLEEGQ
ncbi:hypothetical protein U879_04035 [Defluviimonas sp. 20V17]|uniref:Transposase DDE domain group 1 n=1 Tax=Allgaiera indica TaxID=765699 RepID=A0AAN4UUH1_9RHOB|nr:transposase [Allgaiera indica]KDB04963.1 hypothetical protein U879_04035 [Defluviimonas sp. 20V17]GHE05396.1 hypothetical protein GCM10008024_35950 [Allgaiera indica]SDX72762.1 Transposase DDE domain group 1 [Allgaiera indica]